jgi:hypothetical protein
MVTSLLTELKHTCSNGDAPKPCLACGYVIGYHDALRGEGEAERWIAVAEREPDNDQPVWFFIAGLVHAGTYVGSRQGTFEIHPGYFLYVKGVGSCLTVTYWKPRYVEPVPAPPVEHTCAKSGRRKGYCDTCDTDNCEHANPLRLGRTDAPPCLACASNELRTQSQICPDCKRPYVLDWMSQEDDQCERRLDPTGGREACLKATVAHLRTSNTRLVAELAQARTERGHLEEAAIMLRETNDIGTHLFERFMAWADRDRESEAKRTKGKAVDQR